MRLVEVKILYNADFNLYDTGTEEDITQFIGMMHEHPDVIHVSRTIIEGGDDEG